MKIISYLANLILLIAVFSCMNEQSQSLDYKAPSLIKEGNPYQIFFDQNPELCANGFDFPVGKPNAKGYYNAQPFQENNHLGEDWNAVTGGNTDLGDPIFAIGNGIVSEAKDQGPGWGNVIRIVHYNKNLPTKFVESLYAHCDSILVKKGKAIRKGEKIGTIGNADGAYFAHLHLEIRNSINLPLGGGYSRDTIGFLNPTKFINLNRTIQKDSTQH